MKSREIEVGSGSHEGFGLLGAMVNRPVTANLVMLLLVLLGGILLFKTKREVFPNFSLDRISVSVSVPGASAEEIESGVLLAVEQALRSVQGTKRIVSEARRGSGFVSLDLTRGVDVGRALQEAQNAVDRVSTLPVEAERPVVRVVQETDQVLSVLFFADSNHQELYAIAEQVRTGLLQLEEISRVEHAERRNREITVEVDALSLEQLELSYEEIAGELRNHSLDRLGGYLEGEVEESVVRYANRMYSKEDYEQVEVKNGGEGGAVVLSGIARVRDSFGDSRTRSFFEGRAAAQLVVFREGAERPDSIVQSFHDYMQENPLPEGVAYRIVEDTSVELSGRISLMLNNAWMGLVLVWISLSLFLDSRVAFWVVLGIPVCFVGAFIPIYFLGGTINMFSLAAFIITLGIVVDDAIIVGEGVYECQRAGYRGRAAAHRALHQLGGPVVFAVLTNVMAFLPMLFLPGLLGKVLFHIPVVVVSVLLVSLAESLLVLPAHLGSMDESRSQGSVRRWVEDGLDAFVCGPFEAWLSTALRNRYLTLSLLLAGLLLCLGLLTGGIVKTAFTPRLESNVVVAIARLPAGAPFAIAEKVELSLSTSLSEVVEELGLGDEVVAGTWSMISDSEFDSDRNTGGRLNVRVKLFLSPGVEHELGAEEIADIWKRNVGTLAGVDFVGFSGSEDVGAEPILIELRHSEMESANEAAVELEELIAAYGLASSVDTGVELRVASFELGLNARGRALGISDQALADGVRAVLYGVEALRFQDGLEEVKVMVRGERGSARSGSDLARLPLRVGGVGSVYLGDVADIDRGTVVEQVVRSNGARVVPVSIELEPEVDEDGFARLLEETILPELSKRYPGLAYSFEGEQREDQETFDALGLGLGLACMGIYSLIAISFNSYTKPLVVILVVPFGIGGAILGHLVMGLPFSLVSFVGVLALSGIVVNDALVLVHAAQGFENEGEGFFKAAIKGAQRRLRPIMLTSVTTFVGLLPMLFETSMQARFLVPLAVSIGFGILFSTLTTLLVVPCLLLVRLDLFGLAKRGESAG